MRAILIEVIEKCLVLLIPTAILYIIFCVLFSIIKKKKPSFKKSLLVFIFIYYLLCTIRLTLFFEPSSQNAQNFLPFNFILYGYKEVLEQFIYNILLFIPLGIFLPAVFKKKINKWTNVILISLISSFVIETLQFFIGRNVDINDLIANTMGGITGYALYTIINKIYITKKKNIKLNKLSIIINVIVVLIVPLSVPIAYSAYESTLPYGYTTLYSLHLDEDAVINVLLSDEESQKMIYKEIPVDPADKINNIMNNLGIDGEIYTNEDGVPLGATAQLENGSIINIGINIEQGYTWYLRIDNMQNTSTTELSPEQLLDKSVLWLNHNGFEVDNGMIESRDFYDDVFRIVYKVTRNINDRLIYGSIITELNRYGQIVYVEDNRVYYSEVESSAVISSKEAIKKAQLLPYDSVKRKNMKVESIFLDYMRYNNSSYLLPVWKLSGTYKNDKNETKEWTSSVSALE